MKNFMYIGSADTTALLNTVYSKPELWKADTYLRDYPQGPFGDTETIFARFPPASVTELERGEKDQHECIWMEGCIQLPQIRPIVLWLMSRVEAERIGRVMINKLRPGGRIYPHADSPAHAEYWDRYHVVLQGQAGSNFRCGDETINMQTGSVWWFNHALEHEVINNSASDRLHLIIDLRTFHIEAKAFTPTKIEV